MPLRRILLGLFRQVQRYRPDLLLSIHANGLTLYCTLTNRRLQDVLQRLLQSANSDQTEIQKEALLYLVAVCGRLVPRRDNTVKDKCTSLTLPCRGKNGKKISNSWKTLHIDYGCNAT